MEQLLSPDAMQWVALYGYWAIALVIGLESMGIPLPGETVLISAAALAGAGQGGLSITPIILAAVMGAVVGDSAGYWIGRRIGLGTLLRHGPRIGLTEARLKLGQYLFARHGGKIVFVGRFVPILRVSAALLAGVNRMPWLRFLPFNAAGGIVWASLVGSAAYGLGSSVHRLSGLIGAGLLVVALLALVGMALFIRRNETKLLAEAERALPGPLLDRR
jgi:membrane protein DedA with SNARE-associated domain